MSKHYDEDFKLNALKYRKENPQLTVRAVARNLGISTPTFYNWQKVTNENDGYVLHRGSGTLVVTKLKKLHV